MRTTIDLPDDLYRALKARAGLTGITLRELVRRLIEHSLRVPDRSAASKRRTPPPVIVQARGIPIPALSRSELIAIDDEEDEAKYAGPA